MGRGPARFHLPVGIAKETPLDDEFGKVLRLAPDCDPTSLEIDPAEGFLLSRVDGRTPWRVLREMGAMSPEEVDMVLEGWIARGILAVDEVESDRAAEQRTKRRARETEQRKARDEIQAEAAIPTELDEGLIDDQLDIDVSIQRRILEFELTLRQPYHEILGVAEDADVKKIKRAYFKLSKEFHPDRFFRKQVGDYAARLDRVFKKVTEAYELLSDPTTRAEVEKSMRGAPPPPVAGPDGAVPPQPQRPLTKRERLRQRMPFRLPESILAERQQKAAEFFTAAQISEDRQSFVEAAQNVRLAIAFDPFNDHYKRAFGDIQAKAAEQRATQILDEIGDGVDSGHLKQALRMLEDVLLYRPHDPRINDRAAGVAVELGEVEKAREYAQRSVEHSPDVAGYHRTLAKVHLAAKEKGYAVHALEKATKLDPEDAWSRRMLASLKSHTASAGGGM